MSGQPGVSAEFFVEAVVDHAASAAAGRPVHREIERIRISLQNGNEIVQGVRPDHIERFPAEYEGFRAQQARAAAGEVPIEDWPVAGPAAIVELRALGLITVEAIAAVTDAELEALGAAAAVLRAGMLRDRARAWLDADAREALLGRVIAENDELRLRLAGAERRIAGYVEQFEKIRLLQLPPDRPGQGWIPGALPTPSAVGAGSASLAVGAGSSLDRFAARRPRPPRAPEPELDLDLGGEPVELPLATDDPPPAAA